jgi:hypothetical protein
VATTPEPGGARASLATSSISAGAALAAFATEWLSTEPWARAGAAPDQSDSRFGALSECSDPSGEPCECRATAVHPCAVRLTSAARAANGPVCADGFLGVAVKTSAAGASQGGGLAQACRAEHSERRPARRAPEPLSRFIRSPRRRSGRRCRGRRTRWSARRSAREERQRAALATNTARSGERCRHHASSWRRGERRQC